MIQDYSNHGAIIKDLSPIPEWIYRFLWSTQHDPVFLILIQIILKERTLNVSSSFQFWMKHKLMACWSIIKATAEYRATVNPKFDLLKSDSEGKGCCYHSKTIFCQQTWHYKESSLELLARVLCFTPVLNFNDFCQHCPSCRGWLY